MTSIAASKEQNESATRENIDNDDHLMSLEEELATGFSLSEQAYYSYEEPTSSSSNATSANSNNRHGKNGKNKKNGKRVNNLSLKEIRDSIVDDMMMIPVSSPFTSPSSAATSTNSIKSKSLPLTYCDFTASHRPLKSLEGYMQTKCLPYYGNTHTNTTHTASQSTAFTAEARQCLAEYTQAHITGKASKDVVLFA